MLLRKSLLASALIVAIFLPHLLRFGTADGPVFERSAIFDLVPVAHAAPVSNSLESTAQRFFAGVLEIFTVLNWITLMGVQTLLDPDGIFGVPNGGVRPIEVLLRGLWVLSRNIVNAIFAFILLAGGIYLVIGAGGEGMSKIKQAAPKFVLAVILVNFSWFFPRVILDAANVLTSVVYQVPSLVGSGTANCIKEIDPGPDGALGTSDDIQVKCEFVSRVVLFPPADCTTPLPSPPAQQAGTFPIGCPRPTPTGTPRGFQTSLVDVYYEKLSAMTQQGSFQMQDQAGNTITVPVSAGDVVVNGLAVNFAKIPNFGVIDFQIAGSPPGTQTTLQQAAAYLKFFIRLVIHTILSVAVGLALLAFLAVLVVRMAVLWLCIAFMPFIFVGFAMGKPLGDLGNESAPNIWQKFLSYAFLPTLVAVPFAIGFTLMNQLYYVKSLPVHVLDNVGGILGGIDSFQQLLWMIMAIGIIWFGVFAVLEKDKFAAGIVSSIKGIGTGGMKLAGYGAAYGLQVPLPGGRSLSAGGLVKGAQDLKDKVRFQDPKGGASASGGAASSLQEKISRLPPDQLKALTDPLNNVVRSGVKGKELGALGELTKNLEGMKNPGGERVFSDTDIRGIVKNPEGLRNLVNEGFKKGTMGEKDRDAILQEFDEHFKKTAGGAATGGVSKIDFGLKPSMGVNDTRKLVASVGAGALETHSMDKAELLKEVDIALSNALLASQKAGIQQVRDEIEAGDESSLAARLRKLEDSPPLPGDNSQIA